ncbi:GAF domain-containing protein [Pontibacter qinzhouensis]|uniref:GAF domain-containing protein n=1 Tax=Pontibacter qinzhouensis TaxID=2603253 RepID=A0A5C8J4Q4_9BACT|nr:GAF domain-containing protein [Pontibacter qinzhouensis]TXK31174.1 GAF domain-containing protein [Pontibacter qinzhouensis]
MNQVPIDKNYDSDFCGSIPLHLVNLIQPHGMLLVLDKADHRIIQASDNTARFTGVAAEKLLDQPLAQYLPAEQYQDLVSKVGSKHSYERLPFSFTFLGEQDQTPLTALVHTGADYILMELEQNEPTSGDTSFKGFYQHIKYITSLLKQAGTSLEMAQIAADEMKKLSGFDRVLVYQFDPKWNGVVIAQAKEKDMDDYMDLRFPASDVPRQARELYFRNPYRLIPDKSYKPVRLIPIINPVTNRFTDLSDCNLRSVATVHIEYLTNLGITASMSLPLIINNKLWGLISCHHKTAKHPTYEVRSALELLSDIVAAQLAGKERERTIMTKAELQRVHALLLEDLYTNTNFADGLMLGEPNIAHLLNLTGTAVIYDGGLWTNGQVPNLHEIKELVSWLRRNKTDKLFASSSLPKEYVQSKEYKDVASGLIALPINAEQGEYILGFRTEVLQTIKWGGDPNNAIQMEPDGKSYHPRNSFATYQETVKYTSLPWLQEELEVAETLRSAVLGKIIRDKF